jgi:hypothetical protein
MQEYFGIESSNGRLWIANGDQSSPSCRRDIFDAVELLGTSSEYLAAYFAVFISRRASIIMVSVLVSKSAGFILERTGTEDVDQVAFNFTGDWQRLKFRDRGFYPGSHRP